MSRDRRADSVPLSDRGLRYGDGLFETMLAVDGSVQRFDWHFARLQRGATRLGITLPARSQIDAVILAAIRLGKFSRTRVRLTLTRGDGGAGYAPAGDAASRLVAHADPIKPIACEALEKGIDLPCSAILLSSQPLLAGLKHLNRLEQVLAAREAAISGHAQQLMLDQQGRMISAISANLHLLIDGQWRTPKLDHCGVAGTVRAELIESFAIIEDELPLAAVDRVEAGFISNALHGIVPLRSLAGRPLPSHPQCRDFIAVLQSRYPAWETR